LDILHLILPGALNKPLNSLNLRTSIRNEMGKFQEIVKADLPTLVDFYATWCGPCRTMQPVLDQLKHEMGNEIRILKIDVDKNQEVAEKFKVRGVPTFILFKSGEILWRQSGGMDINTLKSKIKSAI
jgi:thioredoxin 1